MKEEGKPRFEAVYTVVLFVLAGAAAMMFFTNSYLSAIFAEDDKQGAAALMRFVQAIEAVYFVFVLTVGILRTYGSRLAAPTTTALSILLIFWAPLGTAAFVSWFFWVRKRERVSNQSESSV